MATAPQIEATPEGVRIEMRAPRAIPLVVFMTVWLVAWTFGGVSAVKGLVQSFGFNIIALFMAFWLVGWLVGEVFVLAAILFMLNGVEVVAIENGVLVRRAETFGRGLTWHYPVEAVQGLRTVGSDEGERKTMLAFEYTGKTVRLGTDLDEEGAQAVLAALQAAAPSLR